MYVRSIRATALSLGLMLAACSAQTPQEKQADQIEDAADAEADSIQAAARNEAAGMESQAAELIKQAGPDGSFEARRLKVRADALKKEADLIEDQAEARARAIRDEGKAKASALRAQ